MDQLDNQVEENAFQKIAKQLQQQAKAKAALERDNLKAKRL